MKKIIYSLLLCFILLFTIPSVRANEEIIYKDGKELVVTNVKAMQPANQVIPDSVGYFEEVNAIRYNYVVGDTKYIVLKTNNYLPLDLYDSSCNLDPTMFGNVYVYKGYWAYDKNNRPIIIGNVFNKVNEYNFYVTPSIDTSFNTLSLYYLNNTFGYFYLSSLGNKKIYTYRFYKTYCVDGQYLIDSSENYVVHFDENYSNLPLNLKYQIYNNDYFNPSNITYYSTVNGRWSNYDCIKEVYFKFYFDCFYLVELEPYSNSFYITEYFNIFDNRFSKNLLSIDFLSEIKYSYSYDNMIGKKIEKEKVLLPSNDFINSNIGLGHLFIYEEFVDAEKDNLDYFTPSGSNDLYRFKVSIDEIGTFARHDTLKLNIDYASFLYNGIIYNVHQPDQTHKTVEPGCNCKLNRQIILFTLIFLLFVYLIYLYFKFFRKKIKKDKN